MKKLITLIMIFVLIFISCENDLSQDQINKDFKERIRTLVEKDPNIDLSSESLKGVTSFKELFKDTQFNGNVENWDVQNIVNMDSAFENTPFNRTLNWEPRKVSSLKAMFKNAANFDQDISSWNLLALPALSRADKKEVFSGSKMVDVKKPIKLILGPIDVKDFHLTKTAQTLTSAEFEISNLKDTDNNVLDLSTLNDDEFLSNLKLKGGNPKSLSFQTISPNKFKLNFTINTTTSSDPKAFTFGEEIEATLTYPNLDKPITMSGSLSDKFKIDIPDDAQLSSFKIKDSFPNNEWGKLNNLEIEDAIITYQGVQYPIIGVDPNDFEIDFSRSKDIDHLILRRSNRKEFGFIFTSETFSYTNNKTITLALKHKKTNVLSSNVVTITLQEKLASDFSTYVNMAIPYENNENYVDFASTLIPSTTGGGILNPIGGGGISPIGGGGGISPIGGGGIGPIGGGGISPIRGYKPILQEVLGTFIKAKRVERPKFDVIGKAGHEYDIAVLDPFGNVIGNPYTLVVKNSSNQYEIQNLLAKTYAQYLLTFPIVTTNTTKPITAEFTYEVKDKRLTSIRYSKANVANRTDFNAAEIPVTLIPDAFHTSFDCMLKPDYSKTYYTSPFKGTLTITPNKGSAPNKILLPLQDNNVLPRDTKSLIYRIGNFLNPYTDPTTVIEITTTSDNGFTETFDLKEGVDYVGKDISNTPGVYTITSKLKNSSGEYVESEPKALDTYTKL